MAQEAVTNGRQKRTPKVLTIIIDVVLIAILVFFALYYIFFREKVAYVDNAMLLSRTEMGQTARASLQVKIEEYQNDLTTREQEIQVMYNILEKTEAQEDLRQELEEKVQSYEAFVQEVNQKIREDEEKTLTPVYEEINKAIQEYGRDHRYYMILGATAAGNLVFANNRADITDKLIEYINSKEIEITTPTSEEE